MNHLFPYIERTLVQPDVSISEQYAVLDEVTQLGLAGLTVAPFWVKKMRRELGDTHPAVLSAVIGFPFGYQRTEVKQLDLELALKDGATEVEVVLNTSALLSPTSVWLKIELAKLVAVAHAQERLLTVILPTDLLNAEQTDRMIRLATDAGTNFLKNGTGVASQSFNIESALHFRQAVPRSVGVKIIADGATEADLDALVQAGVERLAIANRISL